jgi:oligosaccharide reducing-end xylanase
MRLTPIFKPPLSWKAEIPGRHRYYDGMWYLMGLPHCSGEFRIFPPK